MSRSRRSKFRDERCTARARWDVPNAFITLQGFLASLVASSDDVIVSKTLDGTVTSSGRAVNGFSAIRRRDDRPSDE